MMTPKTSPWGKVQFCEQIAEGIVSVSTAGHGGLKLSAKRNNQIPEEARIHTGWYEEDCEWAIVALVFPEEFPTVPASAIVQCCKEYNPAAYEAITGEKVKPEESWSLRNHMRGYVA